MITNQRVIKMKNSKIKIDNNEIALEDSLI